MPNNVCDNTSVGILFWRGGKLLLIERRNPPYGFAPPAGHVDDHGTFRDAAKSELEEEVGLTAINLTLVGLGRRENVCRREGGDWHYWHIYIAEALGRVGASEREAKSFVWVDLKALQELASVTRRYMSGEISESDWQRRPGLEPVWLSWFEELGIFGGEYQDWPRTLPSLPNGELRKETMEYCWNWFQYHAGQRLIVFRFFLIVVAIFGAGYGAAWHNNLSGLAVFLSLFIALFSLFFWRLDERNRALVNIGEDFLLEKEKEFYFITGKPLVRFSEGSKSRDKTNFFVRIRLYSFKEVNRWIFATVGFFSFVAFFSAILHLLCA